MLFRPCFRLEKNSSPVSPRDGGTFKSIQALRAVAAILVCLFHAASHFDAAEKTFRVGNAGVDIFFVISGFVMWSVTARRAPSPAAFLRHRLIRLAPIYFLFTCALLALYAALPAAFPHMRPPTLQHVLLSLAFVPHINPDGRMLPVLGQGWTLDFEMFFYLLFALALALPRRWRLPSLALLLLVLPLAGLLLGEALVQRAPPLVLLNPLLVEFLGGILIAQAAAAGARPGRAMSWASLAIGALALALLPNPGADNDWARLLLFGVPSLMVVGGAVGVELATRDFRVGRLPLLLGASSYSLYLSHTFVLSVMGKVWHWGPDWLYTVVATLVSVVAAIQVYRLLEAPLQNAMRRERPAAPATALQ